MPIYGTNDPVFHRFVPRAEQGTAYHSSRGSSSSQGSEDVMLEMIDTTESTGPIGPTDWMEDAACNGKSNLFFAPFAERPEARVRREASARKVCESCDSLQMCQTYARTNRELGFWGGESESERADAGFAPTTPIIGRKRVAEDRARTALANAV